MKQSIIWWVLSAVVLVGFTAKANASECHLTDSQKSVLYYSYSYGVKEDLGLSMVAIAMAESDLGRFNLNLVDPSASPYHVTVDKAVDKLGWSHTPFNYNRAAQKLIDDIEFAASIALETLVWWRDYHNGDWRKTVGSYNGGFKGNPKYVKKIVANIHTIRKCGWLDNLEN